MENRNLQILDFEDKKTNAGKRYTRFKTNEGWMSCFDSKVCEELKGKNPDESVLLEISVSEPDADGKSFSNIKGMGKKGNSESQPTQEKLSSGLPKSNFGANTATMYVSYTKDIFLGILAKEPGNRVYEDVMKNAIELVQQAKKAFE